MCQQWKFDVVADPLTGAVMSRSPLNRIFRCTRECRGLTASRRQAVAAPPATTLTGATEGLER